MLKRFGGVFNACFGGRTGDGDENGGHPAGDRKLPDSLYIHIHTYYLPYPPYNELEKVTTTTTSPFNNIKKQRGHHHHHPIRKKTRYKIVVRNTTRSAYGANQRVFTANRCRI
jgi:hypothetical protein